MVALVSGETVLLVLLVVLVAGLLRSHAEILRRLGAPADVSARASGGAGRAAGVPGPPPAVRKPPDTIAVPIAGATPHGDAVSLDFRGRPAGPTLLAFLTSGCTSCATFWQTLDERRLPPEVQTVIVTRGQDRESPARLRTLSPARVPVVMSTKAWEDYGVPGSPYFVLVDRGIRGEGAATTWPALASLVSDAIADHSAPSGDGGGADAAAGDRDGVGRARAVRIDERLAAAGITAGHPSLYPGRMPSEPEP